MARLPSWRDQVPQSYAGAKKWGSGINPIHARRGGYEERNLAPTPEIQPDPGFTSFDYETPDDYVASPGVDLVFMNAHPNLGEPGVRGRSDLPPYAADTGGGTSGTALRTVKRGRNPKEGHTDSQPRGQAGAGWENKRQGDEMAAKPADDAQVMVQTSMVQRDQIKNNNAATLRGTDAPRAEIGSRHKGMRVKVWSGQERHDDMLPKSQDVFPRPFRYRGAGTSRTEYMEPNQFYGVTPLTRDVPGDVDTGIPESAVYSDDGFPEDFAWW